jgi:hypothetical protein
MKLTSKAIQKALHTVDIASEVYSGQQELPFEEILVPLGEDPRGESMVMQIGLLQNFREGEVDKTVEKIQLQFIQFLIMIPLRIEKNFLADTQALINLLNSVIELPGFGIIDSEQMPFFRYTMTCNHNEVDEELFVMTVGLILYVIDTYVETLEEVAQGHRSFEEFLTDVKQVDVEKDIS